MMRPMSWFMAAIYDRVMGDTEAAGLGEWRTELLAHTSGAVLELGSGTGVNIGLYPEAVTQVVYTEPDTNMRKRLLVRLDEQPDPRATVSDCSAETLPFDDASFDCVVSTLVLCSVDDPAASLAEAHRVLRPDGRLVFIEHVCAPDNPGRLRWQRRIEPFWKFLADGCHLTRDTAAAIEKTGFEITDLTRASMRKAPPFVRPTIRGVAVKRA